MNSPTHSPDRIKAARIANDLAEAPRGTRREPGHFGSNWSGLPTNERWKPTAFNVPATRPQAKPAATLAPCKAITATLAQGEDKVIFMPTGKFKTLKNGERREIKARVEIWSRAVTLGTITYSFSSRAKAVTLSSTPDPGRQDGYSKVNDAPIPPIKLRRTPAEVAAIFRRVLPNQAAALASHLFNA